MRLVLFDIDGTLITDGGASRKAFGEALAEIYGYDDDLGRYDFSGRTDPQIARMVLRDAGRTDEEIDTRSDALWSSYLARLERNLAGATVSALPGMPELVEALAGRDDVILALLTGNIEPGARLKLSPPALNRYFPFGAFGSDSADRNALPPIAIARAAEHGRHRFTAADTVIIGDSIYDVRCGAPYGATTVAIASGKTSAELLRAENPTHFFDSAADVAALVEVITAC